MNETPEVTKNVEVAVEEHAEITESRNTPQSRRVYLMLWKDGPNSGFIVQTNGHPMLVENESVARDLKSGKSVSHESYREYYEQYVGKVEIVVLTKQSWTYSHIDETTFLKRG